MTALTRALVGWATAGRCRDPVHLSIVSQVSDTYQLRLNEANLFLLC